MPASDMHGGLDLRAGQRLIARTVFDAPLWAALVVLCALAGGAVSLAFPAVLARSIDAAVSGDALGADLVALAAVLAVEATASAGAGLAGACYRTAVTARLRHRYVRHVLALGPHGGFATGDLVSRLTVDTPSAGRLLPGLANAVVTLATSVGALAALALIDWRLAAAFVLGVPLMLVLVRRFVLHAGSLVERYEFLQAAIASRLMDAHAGARTIRASGTREQEVRRVLRPLGELSETGRALWGAQRVLSARAAVLLPGLEIIVLAVAGFGVANGRITPGELIAAAAYVRLAMGAFEQVDALMGTVRSRIGAARVAEVLDTAPAIVSAPGAPPLPAGAGALSLRDVTVHAGGRRVLDGLDLEVPAGASVALVGRSGAGKSVLAALAGRLADPDSGSVSLDGADVAAAELADVRRAVAYAFERPAPLGGDLRELIAYGRPGASRAAVEAAARTAQADGFVRRLPEGYDTAPARAPLSGGERQRLGLAQAIVQDARLVVLDDATSALDTATELRVAEALEAALCGRTSLVVAHRAATAARADLVAWLDGGRVRALAPHAELWTDPDYRAVFGAETLMEVAA
jgi:ABC-type multidrug transport system fused ATPase/permease subunit